MIIFLDSDLRLQSTSVRHYGQVCILNAVNVNVGTKNKDSVSEGAGVWGEGQKSHSSTGSPCPGCVIKGRFHLQLKLVTVSWFKNQREESQP